VREVIQLFDNAAKKLVDAELFDEVTVEHFLETQKKWRPIVKDAAQQLYRAGADVGSIPQHFHWDWTSKEADLRVLAFTFFGISCGGELQGLMKLATVGHVARHPEQKGKPIVYVDYLETAPWNIKVLTQAQGKNSRFGAVGSRLIEAAVRKSQEEGFKGRLALHSLPSSEPFYIETCGMTALERDPAKQNLVWCEFTPEQAETFLS